MRYPRWPLRLALPATLAACSALVGVEDRYLVKRLPDASLDDAATPDRDANRAPGDATPGDATLGDATPGDATLGDATLGDATPGDATPDSSSLLQDGGDAFPPEKPEACAVGGDAANFYVDRSAGAGCAYATIRAAAAAARASPAAAKTIHLAPGTYDTNTGESFPIDLRGGISMVGAGSNSTVVIGKGPVSQTPPWNAFGALSTSLFVSATILVGDPSLPTTLSGLAIRPGDPSVAGSEAIICDRGNASAATPTPPTPNTTIHDVTIDDFEIGIRVTWSFPPLSGCNALVSASLLQNGSFGVVADGLLNLSGIPQQVVSIQLGAETSGSGNILRDFSVRDANNSAYWNGAGLATIDAVTGVAVRGNRFLQDGDGLGQIGIWAVQQTALTSPGFDIEGNDFGPLTNAGMALFGKVVVGQLVGNTFHGISMQSFPQFGFLGSGLAVVLDHDALFGPPVVTHARGNTFFGNDQGLYFSGKMTLPNAGSLQDDFGTAIDPGGNVFRCNGATWQGGGGDVALVVPSTASFVIPFVGNAWDHAPPTTWIGPGAPAGSDLILSSSTDPDASLLPNVDSADASVTDAPPCPPGRVAGP